MQREIAYRILKKVLIEKEFANLLMQKELNKLKPIQRPFVTELVNGVLRNYLYLRYEVLCYCHNKVKEKNIILLAMAFYERFYLYEKDYVVNSQYVALAESKAQKSFINAVLHNAHELKEIALAKDEKEATLNSLPLWLYLLLKNQYPSDLDYILKDLKTIPDITYRLNPLKADKDELIKLGAIFINDKAFRADNNFLNIPNFKDGQYYVQDINAMALVDMLPLKKDDLLLDMCSAPGSKFFNCLEKVDAFNCFSNDLSDIRESLVLKNAHKLGYKDFKTTSLDARDLIKYYDFKFDKILLDAPCSGLGVLKRKPDLKYRLKNTDLDNLELLQAELLDSAYLLLKKNGYLLYSTCTLNRKENEKQINKFLNKYQNMSLIADKLFLYEKGDHFYGALLKKETD